MLCFCLRVVRVADLDDNVFDVLNLGEITFDSNRNVLPARNKFSTRNVGVRTLDRREDLGDSNAVLKKLILLDSNLNLAKIATTQLGLGDATHLAKLVDNLVFQQVSQIAAAELIRADGERQNRSRAVIKLRNDWLSGVLWNRIEDPINLGANVVDRTLGVNSEFKLDGDNRNAFLGLTLNLADSTDARYRLFNLSGDQLVHVLGSRSGVGSRDDNRPKVNLGVILLSHAGIRHETN